MWLPIDVDGEWIDAGSTVGVVIPGAFYDGAFSAAFFIDEVVFEGLPDIWQVAPSPGGGWSPSLGVTSVWTDRPVVGGGAWT